jgi:CRISPR-associated protein Cas5d
MGYGVKVECWGDYALFSRPELKVERVSYDVMTPSAARGIIEAIYWHPGLHWYIDRIYICNPIRFTNIRRNEVKEIVSGANVLSVMNGAKKNLYINTSESIQQRAAMVLKNVRYIIEAHFELTADAAACDNHGKFTDIIKRRLRKGQCYHQPYLGTREFPANFRLFEEDTIATVYDDINEQDFGIMLYDLDYNAKDGIQPMFYRAVMKHGVIEVHGQEVLR